MPFPFINQLVTSLHQIADEYLSPKSPALPALQPERTAQSVAPPKKATTLMDDPWTPDNYHYAG